MGSVSPYRAFTVCKAPYQRLDAQYLHLIVVTVLGGGANIIPIIQVRKLRLSKTRLNAQCHLVSKCGQGFEPTSTGSQANT